MLSKAINGVKYRKESRISGFMSVGCFFWSGNYIE